MGVVGTRAHLVTVLCDLMLEHRMLLLQMESYSFKPLLLLPELVHTRVGRDVYVRHSPVPIGSCGGVMFPT
jgi:hypothetical protein